MGQTTSQTNWCIPNRVAYVVDHSYPDTSDGYAVRTHEVARALNELGHEAIVFNRPGRPWDIEGFDPARTVASEQSIDGVRYVFLPTKGADPAMAQRFRLRQAEKVLAEAFEIYRPGAVLAASNWENAEPAQNVARRRMVPFFYEQRGFWELSRAAVEPEFETRKEFARIREYETRVALDARAVFTLNQAMAQELCRRGIPSGKIHLVPNGIATPGRITRGVDRKALGVTSRHLLGYIGSLGDYEGSSLLIALLARLRSMGLDVALMIVGSSAPKGLIGSTYPSLAETDLKAAATAQGVVDHVHFVPQAPQDRIGAYYTMLDALIIPRRRTAVTELVAPLKPYSAAAHGVPVFMTDMPPLDEIAPDIHASLFPEGDIDALARMISQMLIQGGHPAVMNPVKASVYWRARVGPLSRALTMAAREYPPISTMMGLRSDALASAARPRRAVPNFDDRNLPQVVLGLASQDMRVVAIGPCTHLGSHGAVRTNRAKLLSELATGQPGRFVIDWVGLEAAPGEWEGLWSIDNLRLTRQVMDACRIARGRGWQIQVTRPVTRAKAPLFQTVRGLVEIIALPSSPRPFALEAAQ